MFRRRVILGIVQAKGLFWLRNRHFAIIHNLRQRLFLINLSASAMAVEAAISLAGKFVTFSTDNLLGIGALVGNTGKVEEVN
jgi:hypothetical protein